MKKHSCTKAIVCYFMLASITGCALQKMVYRSDLEAAQEQVIKAQKEFESISRLGIQRAYPDDFGETERSLRKAEDDLKKLQKLFVSDSVLKKDDIQRLHASIMENAGRSQIGSQTILKKYYLDTVVPMLQTTEKRFDKDAKEATSPIEEFQPLIAEISKKVDDVESGQKILTLAEVIKDIDTLVQANTIISSDVQKTLRVDDIFFEIGKYKLSKKGERLLDKSAGQIIAVRKEMREQYPNKEIIIHTKVVGYTDEIDFQSDALLEELTTNIGHELPKDKTKRRTLLNQRLSELRAISVLEYLERRISQIGSGVNMKKEILGKGEAIPPDVAPPFFINDYRRRICKIYCYVIVR